MESSLISVSIFSHIYFLFRNIRSAEITFVLDSKKLHDFGLNQTSVYLGERPGDKIAPEKEIVVSAVLLPSFDKLTAEQKELAPKVELSTTDLNLGSFTARRSGREKS